MTLGSVEALEGASQPSWTPSSALARAVDLAGFLYDPAQDIIYSRMDALQRPLGYAYAFDASALLIDSVIDCEPIFFEAQGKRWMIELWKGQYGLETGCEVGVYNRPLNPPAYYAVLDAAVGTRPYDPAHSYFYQSASEADMLDMSFTLKRDGVPVFTRGPERHWWLTGFKWGLYSTPEQLTVDVSISLPLADMHAGFVAALRAMNYQFKDDGVTVTFEFGKPFAPQPRSSNPQGVAAAQVVQQELVAAYQSFGLTSNDPNHIPAELARKIAAAVVANGPSFLGNVLASKLRSIGQTAAEVATILAVELGAAADAVLSWVTNAGYDIVQWVRSAYAAFVEIFTMNFSSAVEVHNVAVGGVLPSDMTLVSSSVSEGHFMVAPPSLIPAGSVARFYVKDNLGPYGSGGEVVYAYLDAQSNRQQVKFTFGCPTGFSDNYVNSSQRAFAVYGKSGSGSGWGREGQVPGKGHPLYAAYVWGRGPAPQ